MVEQKYGWYSEKSTAVLGTSFYSTPGGGEVEVSLITLTDDPGTVVFYFDDKVCLGPVVDWLRPGRLVLAGRERSSTDFDQ